MSDLTPELGSEATCPHCGFQVDVPVTGGPVRCPSCGAVVEGGWAEQAETDLTDEELLRSMAVNGYDTEVQVVEPSSLACGGCGQVNPASAWALDDVRRASTVLTPGAPEAAVAAVRCPHCDRPGRVELALRGGDASADDRVHADLVGRAGRPPG